MIFFRPTKKWIEWLITYANKRIVVDLGCGEGLLLKSLYKKGYNRLIGVDYLIDDSLRFELPNTHLLEIDATNNSILKGLTDRCLFLFCRPSHGYFVPGTLKGLPEDAEVLYIGKPENISIDIPDGYHCVLLESPDLKEEKTYILRKFR